MTYRILNFVNNLHIVIELEGLGTTLDVDLLWGRKYGEGGIRTHGTVTCTTVFKTVPFDHSGTSPKALELYQNLTN